MKITPINLTRTTNFQGKLKDITMAPFGNEGNLTNGEAYGLTCLLTAIPGIEFAKKGFKGASAFKKIGKVTGGIGIVLGLAVPLFAIFKSLNILGRPTNYKKNSN